MNMLLKKLLILVSMIMLLGSSVIAEVNIDGFVQALFGGRTDDSNPTATEYTASETRLQLRLEDYSDDAEFFARVDFIYDAADSAKYDFELREAYFKFRLGSKLDFKIGRQILTWGTGDLLFINDNFAKDYVSFFIGRDDQYLKAPQTSIRADLYTFFGDLSIVATPRFEPNRLPTGRRLSYYNPIVEYKWGVYQDGIVGDSFYFNPPIPDNNNENLEIAIRLSKQLWNYNLSFYYYHGYYKSPIAMRGEWSNNELTFTPKYPWVDIGGVSLRGSLGGGVFWLESGYMDGSDWRNERFRDTYSSTIKGIVGYEKQVASNLTINTQWYIEHNIDYNQMASLFKKNDETKHLFTSRITKLLMDENLKISGFIFYSPSDEDSYVRLNSEYKHSDAVTLALGANIFNGKHINTEFGQLQKNDNVFLKMTYGF